MTEPAAKRTATRTGLAVSVLLHLAFVTAAILSLPWRGPPPEPRSVQVSLVAPPQPAERSRSRVPPQTSARPAPAEAPIVPAIVTPTANPVSASATAPARAGDDQAPGKVRAMLRGSVGCNEETFVHLSQQERDRCAKWRLAQVKPGLEIAAPIAPEKRAWFDATVAARQAPDHGPGVSCFVKPPHGLKLGPLPCYLEPPKGPLSEDVDAPPEPDRRR